MNTENLFILLESIELMGKNSKINLHLMPIAFRRNNAETRKTKTKQKKQEKLKVPIQNRINVRIY